MSDQSTEEQSTEEEQSSAPKTYAEWREPLHKHFVGEELTGEDKEAAEKGGISSEPAYVSNHAVPEASESEDAPESESSEPTYYGSGDTSEAV